MAEASSGNHKKLTRPMLIPGAITLAVTALRLIGDFLPTLSEGAD